MCCTLAGVLALFLFPLMEKRTPQGFQLIAQGTPWVKGTPQIPILVVALRRLEMFYRRIFFILKSISYLYRFKPNRHANLPKEHP